MLPRILALVCALPILSFIGSMAALYGGGLVAWFYGGMGPAIFIGRRMLPCRSPISRSAASRRRSWRW